jgi:hypothetical protein
MTSCVTIECPENCGEALPNVLFKLCNPEFHFGQISDIYLTNVGYPLTDENDAAEWAARMALADSNPAKIIRLVGIGSMPNPETASVEASHGRTAYGTKSRTVPFKIDEVSDENYEFMRKTECGKTVLFWPKTLNGKAFGGPSGIEASMNFGHDLPESASELENLPGVFTWKKKISPCRFDHPLHGDTSDLES